MRHMIGRAARIRKTYRHLQRFRSIVTVLLKYGYEDIVQRLHLPILLDIPLPAKITAPPGLTPAERFRAACEELGPTFVKLGQVLSTRPDLLPPGFAEELTKLQDSATPLPFSDVVAVLDEELPGGHQAHFEDINPAPLGAASIAQVHRARLKSGEQIVIKVQRPGIRKQVDADVDILRQFAALMEEHNDAWRPHRPTHVVEELIRKLEGELDFAREAGNTVRFAKNFEGEPNIRVPRVYHSATTSRVLTLEYIEGTKASNLAQDGLGFDRGLVAHRLADLMLRQIFEYGFFHADPHPGNIHILPDNTIAFLDFGQMGFLDTGEREDFADMLWGVSRRDSAHVAHALARLGSAAAGSRSGLEADAADFMHQHFYRPVGQLQFGRLVTQLLEITGRHDLEMPADFYVMLKGLSSTESLVRTLDPSVDIIEKAAPIVRKARLDRYRPGRVAEEFVDAGLQLGSFARDLPGELRRILDKIKKGEQRIIFHHDGLDPLLHSWDQVSNRIAYAVVLGSLIIGSSLMVHADIPPRWAGVPVIGLLGFVIAGLMGFWLLIAILRHGRM